MKKLRNSKMLASIIALGCVLLGLLLLGISFKIGILKDFMDAMTIIAPLGLIASLILLISTCHMVFKDRKNKNSQEVKDEF